MSDDKEPIQFPGSKDAEEVYVDPHEVLDRISFILSHSEAFMVIGFQETGETGVDINSAVMRRKEESDILRLVEDQIPSIVERVMQRYRERGY